MRRSLSFLQLLPWLITSLLGCGPAEIETEAGPQPSAEVSGRQFAEEISTATQMMYCPTVATNISYNKELFISDSTTLTDPCLTKGAMCTGKEMLKLKWNFLYLMRQIAGGPTLTDGQVAEFVLNWLYKYVDSLSVNGQKLENRTKILDLVIKPWRLNSGCTADRKDPCPTLNAEWAPFRLLAVVNRMDVRSVTGSSYGSGAAGEGRLIFGFLYIDPAGVEKALPGTVILEYELPSRSIIDTVNWAERWHDLGTSTLGTENYKLKLQAITEKFVASGVRSKGEFNNGSALMRLRTGEHAFADPAAPIAYHEFREFQLQCATGDAGCLASRTGAQLMPVTTGLTPVSQYQTDGTARGKLATMLDGQSSAVLAERHEIPADFLGGAAQIEIKSDAFRWTPMTAKPDVRRLFAFSTCTGCHFRETQNGKDDNLLTGFFIDPETRMLNGFMSNQIKVKDVTGVEFLYNEPLRRKCEFEYLLKSASRTPFTAASGRPH